MAAASMKRTGRVTARCASQQQLSMIFILLLLQLVSAFLTADSKQSTAASHVSRHQQWFRRSRAGRPTSTSSTSSRQSAAEGHSETALKENAFHEDRSERTKQFHQNTAYIQSLLVNLTNVLDRWILNGSPAEQTRAHNILKQMEREAMDDELLQQAYRTIKRAGMPLPGVPATPATGSGAVELGKTDNASERRHQAEARRAWELQHRSKGVSGTVSTNAAGAKVSERVGRSALSTRATNNGKPDVVLSAMDSRLQPEAFANDKKALEQSLRQTGGASTPASGLTPSSIGSSLTTHSGSMHDAYSRSSELVAVAGASNFDGEYLGIGGLDDVLAQVKRRVWVPLAAPPQLLQELGILPVRGLLLYGMPGCGKTLLARTIGKILSPARPVTVVSGPELMDKFVGSSEKNLREVFDNPPDIYDSFRLHEPDGGESLARAALHVIIMDEFDAMARSRGGRDGKGDQGDAGVARDSVVNQLLAKMDGVDSLVVPTLVIGLTNKRSLIEAALLRPGRFEVQIEVPPPRTMEQRVSILKVHTRQMYDAGRLLVRDAPEGSPARRHSEDGSDKLVSYNELLDLLATECDGMSGASLAGVARAAASHALERAVEKFSASAVEGHPVLDCVVTRSDFEGAVKDVFESSGDTDWEEVNDNSVEKDIDEEEAVSDSDYSDSSD